MKKKEDDLSKVDVQEREFLYLLTFRFPEKAFDPSNTPQTTPVWWLDRCGFLYLNWLRGHNSGSLHWHNIRNHVHRRFLLDRGCW